MIRDFSWSQISSFEFDPEQWFISYIERIRQSSPQLTFGDKVDKRLQSDPTFLPMVERYPIPQHKMRAKFGDLWLIGFADGWDPAGKRLKDDKTGVNPWDQLRADSTGQLTMYALLLHLAEKIKPEDISMFISWLPTVQKGDWTIGFRDNPVVPVVIETRRTMRQCLEFGARIKRVRKEMLAYAQNHI